MDPSGSGIGKAAGDLLKEMKDAQEQLQKKGVGQNQGGQQTSFQQTLQAQQTQNPQQVQNANKINETAKARSILQAAKINATQGTTRVGAAAKVEKSRIADLITRLTGGQDRMTGIMNMALSGRQFSPQELLALQAGVYRFSQELELTSKVVEKATSGIKQTMNTQV